MVQDNFIRVHPDIVSDPARPDQATVKLLSGFLCSHSEGPAGMLEGHSVTAHAAQYDSAGTKVASAPCTCRPACCDCSIE